jgi:hypothetical protein
LIFWRDANANNDTISVPPGTTYGFGLYSCEAEKETHSKVYPYRLNFPSINTFTFLTKGDQKTFKDCPANFVLEYYDSKDGLSLHRTRTDVVFKRQSVATLPGFGSKHLSARVVYAPEGYSTNVQQFIVSPSFNLLVAIGEPD